MTGKTLPRWISSWTCRRFAHQTGVRRRTVFLGLEWLETRELLSSTPGLPDFSEVRNDLSQFRNDMTTSAVTVVNAVQPSPTNAPTAASVPNEWSKALNVLVSDWSKAYQAFVQVEHAALAMLQQEFDILLGIPMPGQSATPPPAAATSPNLSPANIGASAHPVPAAAPIVTGTAGKNTVANSSPANLGASPHPVPAISPSPSGSDGKDAIPNDPSEIYTTPGSYTWISPLTGTVTVQAWGGGGGGSGGSSGGGYGGGGGGYGTETVSVIAGDTYTLVVGAGASGGSAGANGAAGSSSTFDLGSTTYITAAGGGAGTLTGGGTGASYSGTGVTGYSGGNGQGPQQSTYLPGGGGGGGAGSGGSGGGGGAGSSSSGGAGGSGGTPNGGRGGAGGNSGANGSNAAALGGGGGGGSSTGSGGKGANGEVEITWSGSNEPLLTPAMASSDSDTLLQQNPASTGPTSAPMTVASVRYADGVATIAQTDLSSSGFGFDWGQTRTWSNGSGYATGSVNGNGWVDTYIPHLIQSDGSTNNTIIFLGSGDTASYYNLVNGVYQPLLDDGSKLTYNSGTDQFTLIDNQGDQIVLNGFGTTHSGAEGGEFASYTDANGIQITATYNTSGTVGEMQRKFFVNGQPTIESYLYSYLSSGVNAGLLSNVTLRTQVSGGAWTTVRQVAYAYYDGTQTYGGNIGDLMTATVEDGGAHMLDTSYYRYYTSNSSIGYTHGLEYVFSPDSYLRMTAANQGISLGNLTDSEVYAYADNYFQYNSAHQVSQETVQGGDSKMNGGLGTYTFSYSSSTNPQGTNDWSNETLVTNPDASTDTVFTNFCGEVILDAHTDPSSGVTTENYYEYNAQGQLYFEAAPSAVTGYSASYSDVVGYANGALPDVNYYGGLTTYYAYFTTTTAGETTAGAVAGYLGEVLLAQGLAGTKIQQEYYTYYAHALAGQTIAPIATDSVFRNIGGSGEETTTYSYTWYTGTAQMQSETDTAPVISSGQNGPGVADVTKTLYDTYGNAQWIRDPDGYIERDDYDPLTGALLTQVIDDSTNLPSGWTAPGNDLNLTTTYVVDALGRTTEETSPNGNITYYAYLDQQHEERIYRGWNPGATPPNATDPIEVIHHDAYDGYDETLTMTATPSLTNGVPNGTEAIGNLQTLTRDYFNAAGQVVSQYAFFNFGTLTYNTLSMAQVNVNYYLTTYGYDSDGNLVQTVTPNGTIYRTVYNSLGEKVSAWVGTNDTPTSGEWSPANNKSPCNMVMVSSYVYDNGRVGDGNLTQEIDYPGLSQPNRETDSWYDWRDRLVAQKSGVESQQIEQSDGVNRPIIVTTYDNQDEVTETQQYLGDGVTPSISNGVLSPLAANSLRAQEIDSYDDQGRVYQTQVYDVSSLNNYAPSGALTTNYYRDLRGDVIAESDPGGLWTKSQYDGAGRDVMDYTTDGAGGTASWSAISSVTNDTVLEQTQTNYDNDGNVIETIDSQRFENATGTGPLGNPSSGIGARVSYAANYYDNADRLTASVDVGTNHGSAWIRPGSAPPSSSTVLTTTDQYNSMGLVQEVTDPMGFNTFTVYDNLGRTIKTIAHYTGAAETDNSDIATEYGYDGNNNEIYVQADEPGGSYQKTAYLYGVTTGSGLSGVNSNDILSAIEHPDPTTGQPSSSQQESYLVNALGENVQYTDRAGNVHQYSYDVLGRETADNVTQFATGVDQTVKQHTYAYDSQGNQYLISSLNASGGIVNQVQDVYNGLDQLTGEYQSHSGAVVAGTPEVQYGYTELTDGNNSRLTSMTYPDGYVLYYNYNSGLDSNISRLSSLYDIENGLHVTLESYQYLGLDTAVERDHPQISVNQTYIATQQGQTGDGGDQYVGLDRFGRVVDQNWYDTNTSSSTDNFANGYDQDSDVLYKQNLADTAMSELYQYDNLNQLVSYARGQLNATDNGIVSGTQTDSQGWSPNAVGDFTSVTTNGTQQTRTSNQQNETTALGSEVLTYDANGNLSNDGNGNSLTYDAWNHLVQIYNNPNDLTVSYSYDGLGRLIGIVNNNNLVPLTIDQYDSSSGQVLEEYYNQGSGSQPQARNVWSPVYVNALVLRDYSTNSNGTIDSRVYVQQDANWNVTALLAGTTNLGSLGSVLERYDYEPYGAVTDLNPDFSVSDLGFDPYGMPYLWQGMEIDLQTEQQQPTADLYFSEDGRIFSTQLSTWLQTDPTGLSAGTDDYEGMGDAPTDRLDPMGTSWFRDFENWMDNTAGAALGNAYNNSAGFAGTVNAVDKLARAPINMAKEVYEDPLGMKRIESTVNRVAEGYTTARNGGENVAGAAVLGILLPVADTVGVTSLNESYVGKELITNRELSDAERVEKGILGSVQVANTALTVAGLAEMVGPGAASEAAAAAEARAAGAEARLAAAESKATAQRTGLVGPNGKPLGGPSPNDPFNSVLGPNGKPMRDPNILSGHGAYNSANGTVVVPEGTSVTVYANHGETILDSVGGLIDRGMTPPGSQCYGARTYLPGAEMPNYTLYPPDGLNILGNPTTVTRPYNLSAFLRPNRGNINWSACLEVIP